MVSWEIKRVEKSNKGAEEKNESKQPHSLPQ
jgi:hypothetical protein